MAEEMVRITCWVEMNAIAGSTREDTVEVPRSEWDAMTEEQRSNLLNEHAADWMSNCVEFGAYVDED